ncbi:TetR/AcrR family transcriptional regulator [Mycobacterium vicinigordonae]|uniref:TetR/AcrR family transcriptional regulator n=1 Tax=Mycobacterium vicinigordonae TaxID=1719132 RepID=UPI001BB3480A|nr:TetR/AcrR family transcriptional regulator [Mycobacterium vicinigordonae]
MTTGTKGQRSDARRNYQQILSVAAVVVREQGTQASLREVARRAGVGLGTLYRHFPTRDALLEAVLSDGMRQLVIRSDQLSHSHSPRDALVQWLREFTSGAAIFTGLPAALIAASTDPQSALYDACTSLSAAAERLAARAQGDGSVRADITGADLIAAAGAIASINESAPPGRTERLLTLLFDGLTP